MKTLPILAALLLGSLVAQAHECPNLAGKYIDEQKNKISISQSEENGVVKYSITDSEGTVEYVIDGQKHAIDGLEVLARCENGALITDGGFTNVLDFRDRPAEAILKEDQDPAQSEFERELDRMAKDVFNKRQRLEQTTALHSEMAPTQDRGVAVSVLMINSLKNTVTGESKEFRDVFSGAVKRIEE